MNTARRGRKILAVTAASAILFAACGSDEDGGDGGDDAATEDTSATTEETTGDTQATEDTAGEEETAGGGTGGEFIDLGTFVGDPPEHVDPALNSTLDAYQVINAVYDGLTDIDTTDPAGPQIVPHVAETVEPNEDASVWTFKIREGAQFSDGSEINASTFQKSWSAPPTLPATTATC